MQRTTEGVNRQRLDAKILVPHEPAKAACHCVFRIRPIEPRNSVNGYEHVLTSDSIPCRSIHRRINADALSSVEVEGG